LIQKAMSTAPKTDADCPGGAQAGPGSRVQKCMAKNQVGHCAWMTHAAVKHAAVKHADSSSWPVQGCFQRAMLEVLTMLLVALLRLTTSLPLIFVALSVLCCAVLPTAWPCMTHRRQHLSGCHSSRTARS
jgi:hypothetical protein